MSFVYKPEYKARLQAKLRPEKYWEKLAKVQYTNRKDIHSPYSSDAVSQALTKYAQYAYTTPTTTDDVLSIDTQLVIPELIDRADLVENGYVTAMNRADEQAERIKLDLETKLWADAITNAGNTFDATGMTAANTANKLLGIQKLFIEANAKGKMSSNGIFLVINPTTQMTIAEYAGVSGFRVSDEEIRSGKVDRIQGFDIYVSNLLPAGKAIAGINKYSIDMAILRGTYGDVVFKEDPDRQSAHGIISRVDVGVHAFEKAKPTLIDISV